ncbi:MAG TPA: methyltransferase [Patescibacteria group bacterium]|nr:methyltransferase [Patescibacteria group bacterium]
MPQVTIEKLIFGGQGLGRVGNKVAFVWGGLPGEEVEFEVTKSKKNFMEGLVTKVITPAPERISSVEDHYLSCSPWQVLSQEAETKWKKEIALETYFKNGGIKLKNIELINGTEQHHYRNKMEYNFFATTDNKIHLAFHTRGTHQLRPIGDCALASPEILRATRTLLEWLNQEQVPRNVLKSVIARSDSAGHSALALFIKDPHAFHTILPLDAELVGLQMYRSDFRSPASVPTELLYEAGQNFLETKLLDTKLRFGLLSFFQVNVPVFTEALQDISQFVNGGKVVDFYSGVGSIGLSLHKNIEQAVLVEENKEAVELARQNIEINTIRNIEVKHALAEQALEYIEPDTTVIFDPPRVGLHKKVVEKIAAVLPKRIIYLSCGLDTQARDIGMLLPHYRPIYWKLYNFFPRTPHIEGLCVLECL